MANPDVAAACDRLSDRFERASRGLAGGSGRPDGRVPEPLHRLAAALLRMRVRPALEADWLVRDPVHVSLLGGTNTGKSTVLNLLLGRGAAGMNVTARFSQHPEGYRFASLGDSWIDDFPTRFAGYARHRDEHPPRQSDADLAAGRYRTAIALLDPSRTGAGAGAGAPAFAPPTATTAVLWDVPDFSTEEAAHWLGAVLDTVALADIVLFVVTDESYADERTCTLLGLVSAAGLSVHVVANKAAGDASLVGDIRRKVDLHWRGAGTGLPDACFHALPFVEGADPQARLRHLLDTEGASSLRSAIGREVEEALPRKRAGLAGCVRLLESRVEDLVRPMTEEACVAKAWDETVRRVTDREFLERYRTDYLDGERYGEFNQTLVRLMERLEVPGIGEVTKLLGQIVRIPVTMLTAMIRRALGRTKRAPAHTPEHEVIAARFAVWLEALRSEAQRAAAEDRAWARVAATLDSEAFVAKLTERLEAGYAATRPQIEEEVRRCARAIHEAIEGRPLLLNALRSANLAVDATAVFLVVKSGGLNWSDAIVGPAVAGLRRVLLESGLDQFLGAQERALKRRQGEAMDAMIRSQLAAPVRDLAPAEFGPGIEEEVRADLRVVVEAVAGAAPEEAKR